MQFVVHRNANDNQARKKKKGGKKIKNNYNRKKNISCSLPDGISQAERYSHLPVGSEKLIKLSS